MTDYAIEVRNQDNHEVVNRQTIETDQPVTLTEDGEIKPAEIEGRDKEEGMNAIAATVQLVGGFARNEQAERIMEDHDGELETTTLEWDSKKELKQKLSHLNGYIEAKANYYFNIERATEAVWCADKLHFVEDSNVEITYSTTQGFPIRFKLADGDKRSSFVLAPKLKPNDSPKVIGVE